MPAFPVRLQAPPVPPTAWQVTLPFEATTRMAWPEAQVPVTRFCRAAESIPSYRSAFRLTTLVVELTLNGERVQDRLPHVFPSVF